MANVVWYKQKKFIPIYVGVALFIIAAVLGFIKYMKENPNGSFF